MLRIIPFLILLFAAFFWLTSSAQTSKKITGTVTSAEDNLVLPGVSVRIKGAANGTLTDANGKFTLNATTGDVLVFSYISFQKKEITVNTEVQLNIQLKSANNELDEIVVVGYGSQKKEDVTGSISSISSKALREVPVTSAPQMLQGRSAGVYVLSSGNKPGSGSKVQIRGRRSFNAGNDPLYVIDGIPISGGLNDINPNDIESIDVLKDASATAIYGSRGANGVIIVTTKRGKSGRTSVSYDNYFGVSTIMKYADIMNGAQFAEYKRESRRAAIVTATGKPQYDDTDPLADSKLFETVELKSIAEGRSTDYQRLMVKNGYNQNHELSVMGGSEQTRFNISLGYFNDKGIIPGQDFKRYTSRFNIDQTIGRFKVGMSSLGSYSLRNGEDTNPYGGTVIENPLGVPYDDQGNLIFLPTSDGLRSNPLSELVPGAVINQGKRFRLLSNIYGEAEILDGLKLKMNFGPDLIQNRKGNFNGRLTNSRRNGDPSASDSEDFVLAYTWENILTYQKLIANKHSFNFTGLYGVQTRQLERSNINVIGLPVESLENYNLGAATTISGVGSGFEKWSILSYMARLNYTFDDRLLVTLTGRADGSSKFAPGQQWGYFPSVALGWNVNNENFLKDSKTISKLKLRLSYGQTGNEGISPYQTNGLLGRTVYDFDGAPAYGYRPNTIRNQNLKWETTASFNAGVDFGLLNNRISGTLEVYQSKTTDLLLPRLLPITSGFASILSNVGSKRNRGIEFSLSTLNIVPKTPGGFEWSTDLNFFTNKEEILELSQGKVDDIGNARFIGQPALVYYDFVKTGIWQTGQEELAKQFGSRVGQIKVEDVNGNGVIDPGDRKILGSDVPKLVGGMTHRFGYKGFDLSILAFARWGSLLRSPVHQGSLTSLFGRYNSFNLDYWTKTNPTNAYPQPNVNQESPLFGSTLQYFDGSFVKIRNINLGYNFSPKLAEKIKTQSLRIYISAQNPFVFSAYTNKYNGVDPEIELDGNNNPVINTPAFRTFLVGLNVKF
ncbi:TonB-linked SusC/RagA family outer membrane protein [Pedobacter sp. CG_S7]|uniref:SusC/RagA family TonB-linked outer membrane protein n=1 Tax=Pedobacter sp. CG_S7 TaxID=3143930 RepID=UPI0033968134